MISLLFFIGLVAIVALKADTFTGAALLLIFAALCCFSADYLKPSFGLAVACVAVFWFYPGYIAVLFFMVLAAIDVAVKRGV